MLVLNPGLVSLLHWSLLDAKPKGAAHTERTRGTQRREPQRSVPGHSEQTPGLTLFSIPDPSLFNKKLTLEYTVPEQFVFMSVFACS